MVKFIDILSSVISEQKRYKLQPEVYEKLHKITDELWSIRKKKFTKKTLFDEFPFKLANGVDGLVKVYINPRLPYFGYMGTKPKKSLDPADIYIDVNPNRSDSKKNIFLTLYHEMIHASDPTQSHLWTPKYHSTYNEKRDEFYWGHPIEFFAITNEFLEGLLLEFKRRKGRMRNPANVKILAKSFRNILNYFARGEKLTNQSLDILYRINDEYLNPDAITQSISNIQTDFPEVSELIPTKKDDIPYFLNYVQLIKRYNPKIWPRFLTMLYKFSEEIEEILK